MKPSEHALEMLFPYKDLVLFSLTRQGMDITPVTVIEGDATVVGAAVGGLTIFMSYGPDVTVVGYIGGCTMTYL